MRKIKDYSKGQSSVYEHLKPIVAELVSNGNETLLRGNWGSSKEGFVCYLKNPIDFKLLHEKFEFPSSIVLSVENDLVACRETWATIYGNKSHVRK